MSYGEIGWLIFKLGGSFLLTGVWMGALYLVWTCWEWRSRDGFRKTEREI